MLFVFSIIFVFIEIIYNNTQRNVIFFVTKPAVIAKIKELILLRDPSAFITIIDTHDVHGGGFTSQAF